MRAPAILFCLVAAITSLACKKQGKQLTGKRVDKLQLKTVTVAVPAGWHVVTEEKALAAMSPPPGALVLVLDHAVDGTMPSIVVQELEMAPHEHQSTHNATVELCTQLANAAAAAQPGGTVGAIKTTASGGFKGCDVAFASKGSELEARQIALSNGTSTVSFVCNRDRKGHPEVDRACEGLANGIALK